MIYELKSDFFQAPMNRDVYDCFCGLDFHDGASYTDASNSIPHYNVIQQPFQSVARSPFCGYVLAISQIIRSYIETTYKVKTDKNIYRCHVVEHILSDSCYGMPHKDVYDTIDGEFITGLYYSSLTWDEKFGGNTFIGNQNIKFTPNTLVCFNSRSVHYGEKIYQEIPSRRFALNVVLKVNDNPFEVIGEL